MAKNNQRKNKAHFNKQPSTNPTGKPPQCGTCGKLHNGRSCPFYPSYLNISKFANQGAGECWNKSPSTRPKSNCSYCGKNGHDESVCYKKNTVSVNNCSYCGKKGHDESACYKKNTMPVNNCSYCGKKGHEESVCYKRNNVNSCSHCGKKGHDESVCYKKNLNQKPNPHPSTSITIKAQWSPYDGRWASAMNCQREQDRSAVSFPLTLVGTHNSVPREDAWIEDSDNDAIMCLHNCRGNFCFKRFANKCARQLGQGAIVVSQRDEQAVWQTMTAYGTPNNGFGESPSMDLDEVQ